MTKHKKYSLMHVMDDKYVDDRCNSWEIIEKQICLKVLCKNVIIYSIWRPNDLLQVIASRAQYLLRQTFMMIAKSLSIHLNLNNLVFEIQKLYSDSRYIILTYILRPSCVCN